MIQPITAPVTIVCVWPSSFFRVQSRRREMSSRCVQPSSPGLDPSRGWQHASQALCRALRLSTSFKPLVLLFPIRHYAIVTWKRMEGHLCLCCSASAFIFLILFIEYDQGTLRAFGAHSLRGETSWWITSTSSTVTEDGTCAALDFVAPDTHIRCPL